MRPSIAVTSRRSSLCDGSVVECEQGFLVLSPEMCFVGMAARLSLIEAVVLGFELCGTYAVRPDDATCYGRPPLCRKEKLVEFARKAKGAAGRQKALRTGSAIPERRESLAGGAISSGFFAGKVRDLGLSWKAGSAVSEYDQFPKMTVSSTIASIILSCIIAVAFIANVRANRKER